MRLTTALLLLAASSLHAQRHARGPIWYSRSMLRELTGNPTRDSLVLLATGTNPESLSVVFQIFVGRRLVFEDSWSSSAYFAYLTPIDTIPIPTRAQIVWDELLQFFLPDRFGTVDTLLIATREDPRGTMASHFEFERRSPTYQRSPLADSTVTPEQIWEELKQRRPPTFRLFEGGEDSRWITWSQRAHRFVVTDACC
jgi:hypothetical protein